MSDFGRNLRRERESLGVSLEDISKATKISVRLLRAIEEEEFERLPGGIFNINFVRQYARYLHLDEQSVVDDFRQLTAPPSEPNESTGGPPFPAEWVAPKTTGGWQAAQWNEPRNWLAAVIIAGSVAVASAGYIVWNSHRNIEPERAAISAPNSVPSAQPASAEAITPAAPQNQSTEARAAGGSTTADSAQAKAPENSAAAAELKRAPEKPAEVKQNPAADSPGPSAQPSSKPSQPADRGTGAPPTNSNESTAIAATDAVSVAGWAEAPIRVEIQANDLVWVGATADGHPRFQAMLRAQQMRRIAGQQVVRLRVGDAGALAVILNGQLQPALGPKGQVRTVTISAQGMQVAEVSPTQEADHPQSADGTLHPGTPAP
jgi:cytoskeleton protein RodZ